MKRFTASIVLSWFIFGWLPSDGAEKKLSSQAYELKSSLAMLQANSRDRSAQTQYLQKFPKDIHTFRRLFDPPDFSELYDGHEYILVLSDLAQDQPVQVGALLIGLSKDAPQGADALSHLRQVTAEFSVSNTATLAKLLHSRPEKEISKVIWYLADVENHHAYPEYPQIIQNLKKLGETKLAQQFEAAKKERMKKPTHGEMRNEPTST